MSPNGEPGLPQSRATLSALWMERYVTLLHEGSAPMRKIYLIGSLRNPDVPYVASSLRAAGHVVYDDWYAAGPEADDYWQRYEQGRGHTFQQALAGWACHHTYNNDKQHLDESDTGVLVLPAGKSGHLELGYMIGQGKQGFILLNGEPERYDVMYRFATGVATDIPNLIGFLES